MTFPYNKNFAFTIVDDTDYATVENVKPVYDHLYNCGLRTTKTVWVYPPRDKFNGECLLDVNYLHFVKELQEKGFEIALHNVGSGAFTRSEIVRGLEIFKNKIGYYPKIHTNHASNPDNIYWGGKRVTFPLSLIYGIINIGERRRFSGENEKSPYFWGDIHKRCVKYTRNFVFSDINTAKEDPMMPNVNKIRSRYSNFWFSSSDGENVAKFLSLISPKNVDRLIEERGVCIVYTHFASGFCKEGVLNKDFAKAIEYLASWNGWFVPASVLLDHLLETRERDCKVLTKLYKARSEAKWSIEKFFRKIK